MEKPELNSHQVLNNCPNCCLGSVTFGRAAAAITQLHRSRRHRTSRCIHLHHHPEVPLADFSILHWLLASAEAIAAVVCTILLCLVHSKILFSCYSSLPGRDQQRNFKHLLAAQIVVHTHHRAHFLLHYLFSSYLLLPIRL